jgi:hypothetical protein
VLLPGFSSICVSSLITARPSWWGPFVLNNAQLHFRALRMDGALEYCEVPRARLSVCRWGRGVGWGGAAYEFPWQQRCMSARVNLGWTVSQAASRPRRGLMFDDVQPSLRGHHAQSRERIVKRCHRTVVTTRMYTTLFNMGNPLFSPTHNYLSPASVL